MRTMSVVGRHVAHVVDEHAPTKLGASRRGRARLAAIMALALIVRLTYVFAYSRRARLGFDGNHYYELARPMASIAGYPGGNSAVALASSVSS